MSCFTAQENGSIMVVQKFNEGEYKKKEPVTHSFTDSFLAEVCRNRTYPSHLSIRNIGFEDRGSHQCSIHLHDMNIYEISGNNPKNTSRYCNFVVSSLLVINYMLKTALAKAIWLSW